MKLKWFSSNKNIIKFLVLLFLISIFIGIYFYLSQNNIIKLGINEEALKLSDTIKTTRNNNILFHFSIMSILIMLSLLVIGLPVLLFYYFYEGVSLGFLISSLIKYKSIKGFFFSLNFILVNKLFYYIVLTYFIINSINYSKNIIKNIKENKSEIFANMLVKCGFIILTIFIYDIFIYFLGNKILSLFLFLL